MMSRKYLTLRIKFIFVGIIVMYVHVVAWWSYIMYLQYVIIIILYCYIPIGWGLVHIYSLSEVYGT